MKKTVLIVTTQRHLNFGTLLQCHALQHYIEMQGYAVEILDYLGKEYTRTNLQKLRIWLGDLRRNPVKQIRIANNIFRGWKRKKLFAKFLKERITLTSKSYGTSQSIKKKLSCYDIYIAGSDQIWNPQLGGFKPVYFLKFAPENCRKISYAASFGIDSFSENEAKQISAMVIDIDSISCREQSGVEFLRRLGHDATLVLDPTLLLTANYWRSIADKKMIDRFPKKYILSYFLSFSDEKKTMIEQRFCNHKVVDLSVEYDAPSQSIVAVGPEQFLSMIDNCELLVTDSFHGMVFALIFQKDFYVVPRNNSLNSQNTRIENLLEKFGLLERWLPETKLPIEFDKIDYNKVLTIMNKYIDESSQWLKSNLQV